MSPSNFYMSGSQHFCLEYTIRGRCLNTILNEQRLQGPEFLEIFDIKSNSTQDNVISKFNPDTFDNSLNESSISIKHNKHVDSLAIFTTANTVGNNTSYHE